MYLNIVQFFRGLLKIFHVQEACNPDYSGRGDQEYHSSRLTWDKQLARPHLNQLKSWVWWYIPVIPAIRKA
jgi:hypothetical protein